MLIGNVGKEPEVRYIDNGVATATLSLATHTPGYKLPNGTVVPERPDECCGFGGLFSIEEKEVSIRMGQDKLRRHIETGAEYITGPDSSCLMHMQGIARSAGDKIRFIHVVEILASGLK